MTDKSNSSDIIVEIPEESSYRYAYPVNVYVPNFVSVRLSGTRSDRYRLWSGQMICLLKSHEMLGFIDGTFVCPNDEDRSSSTGSRKEKKIMDEANRQWMRSDNLVKGWIFGSLGEDVLGTVIGLESAKDVWEKLKSVYNPTTNYHPVQDTISTSIQVGVETESDTEDYIPPEAELMSEAEIEAKKKEFEAKRKEFEAKEKEKLEAKSKELYEAIIRGRTRDAIDIISKHDKLARTRISANGNRALHVVVGITKHTNLLERLVESIQPEALVGLTNSDGSTALHVAARVGNTHAAKLLVARNRELLNTNDNEGQLPIARAISNMHMDTFLYLLEETKGDNTKHFAHRSVQLLVNAVSAKQFEPACNLIKRYPESGMISDAALMAIAQNFPSELNYWENLIYPFAKVYVYVYTSVLNQQVGRNAIPRKLGRFPTMKGGIEISTSTKIQLFLFECFAPISILLWPFWSLIDFFYRHIFLSVISFLYTYFLHPLLFIVLTTSGVRSCKLIVEKKRLYCSAKSLLDDVCKKINNYECYTNPLLEAACHNAHKVVELIVAKHPSAIWSVNQDGHNIIQLAVINRSEKVYNLIYQMGEHKNVYKTITDSSGNNLLHLAGRLAPLEKFNLISGAALQIQHELRWFKEVEAFVPATCTMQKNSFGEMPKMVFTREHKDLVKEGEQWIKATADSYTITAALITTIVFAAAITVPGGNNQETGIPIFDREIAFTVFAISDAISLFASTTSLLMFLSILTARFAEQDFLVRLPRRLIIGLFTLFLSTSTMIVAFSATLFIVFGQKKAWILIPIAGLACLPITSFVTLQFPLLVELVHSTYGHVFGKQNNHPFFDNW